MCHVYFLMLHLGFEKHLLTKYGHIYVYLYIAPGTYTNILFTKQIWAYLCVSFLCYTWDFKETYLLTKYGHIKGVFIFYQPNIQGPFYFMKLHRLVLKNLQLGSIQGGG